MRNALERSRYAQIALSYTRPLAIRIWAALTAIYLTWILFVREGHSGVQMVILGIGGSFAAWAGAIVTGHAKEQLADARASLTPEYRPPHLVVAAVMFVFAAVGIAVLTARRAQSLDDATAWFDIWTPGYLALVLAMSALFAWAGQLQTPAAAFAVMFSVTPVLFAGGRQWFTDIVRGRQVEGGLVVLGLAIAALVALWWRLGVIHEEMPEYSRLMSPGFRLKVRMTGDPIFRRENAADTGRFEGFVRNLARLDQVARVYSASFGRRIDHWRIVIGLGRAPALVSVLLATMMVSQMLWAMRERDMMAGYPAMLSAMVPGLIVAAIWPRRWYVLADESLRPASRRQFVREQGAAMAMEHATTWAWITAVTFCAALLLGGWSETLPKLVLALPVLASGQLLVFGLLVWILRYRAGWLVIVPMFLALAASMLILVAGAFVVKETHLVGSLAISVVFTIVGLAITFDAHRRWLVTEFD